ncbi:MAG: flagellar export chaperone FliS [Polaromonas sp. 39-63-203]|uniref:flagellar export chaperone FliS n=1 Tax=Polaromonas sp. TaxID=1869339 RepID=UPI000BD39CF4|nr:flagellar export chaperone FliS [Polaromonas sp.]OYY53014.1 MAG: flagellar export chaperone FliS [Polaromonas sp. 35-63-240]OYY99298.1 MAG: flagellar export chaperone FliS [Polaromonas sp. 28-63-22]OYZ84172.1 MAG: flagellar export chaperone FliS [Polaromonas sp. 24-62-144]OZA99115.1 MAG: flagellar export chaperone FliS [Polaromonas sp. 39-63-203]HQS31599.1 flagellar export chaperone FliS [Polaromonas sp.]
MYTPAHAYHPGASAYARIGTESAAMSASPHQLITMLFDGAKTAITMARHHMAHKEIAAKGIAISKAINIIENGLKASLDADVGGAAGAALVANLAALYDYINERLLYANLRNDLAQLDEADRLLESIGSAWREASPRLSSYPPSADSASALFASACLSRGA